MAALTQDRNTAWREDALYSRPVKAATTIFGGSLVMLDANGFAVPGAAATGQTADGVAQEQVTNAGSDGDASVTVLKGVFAFANSAAADEIGAEDVGANCFIVDDQTVALTNGSASRSVAGVIAAVDAEGVWVRIS